MFVAVAAVFLSLKFSLLLADTPANCTYEDVMGKWIFKLGRDGQTNKINCKPDFEVIDSIAIDLTFPNKAIDETGNIGRWTMIYNQGFEVIINGKRYFAFLKYTKTASICSQTSHGWVHDNVHQEMFPPQNWACYQGTKIGPSIVKQKKIDFETFDTSTLYQQNPRYTKVINNVQSSWKAGLYVEYSKMSYYDLIKRGGGVKRTSRVHPNKHVPHDIKELEADLPDNIDWRNKDGQNFISPIRNQGQCGSCYAFASMALLEAAVRIASNNSKQPIFSTQDVVSCSPYSQGCDGGFPYLVAGKYAQDFGVIEEKDYPYIGNTTTCQRPQSAPLTYVYEYGYIGGFYGGCNEVLMRVHLAKFGPLAVSIEVYNDLMFYHSGIYHHTGFKDGFNPWEVTNHVVVIVGYGVQQETGEKYWIVKNSWGTEWGENGYFRVRRGTDEVAIESMAVYAAPFVPQ